MEFKKILEKYWPSGDPVTLIDVGASGFQHPPFKILEGFSRTIEFDPDSRDFDRKSEHGSVIIPKAVTHDKDVKEVTIYLAKEPHCSSTLRPKPENAKEWIYGDAFEIESEVSVDATTIDIALNETQFDSLHWLKLDTQGTDGRIVESLSRKTLDKLLVCEVEPGYCDHYTDADNWGDIHQYMTKNGFFLAEMNNQSQIRMRSNVYKEFVSTYSPLMRKFVKRSLKTCPTAPESLYLRTIASATKLEYTEDHWVRLWVLAMAADQFEYAYDVATEIHDKFGEKRKDLLNETISLIKRRACQNAPRSIVSFLKQKLLR